MLKFFGLGDADASGAQASTEARTNKELMAIQEAIATRKQMLADKQQYIRQVESQNQFLKQVKADYDLYNAKMDAEKERQIRAMEMLTGYLDGLKQQGVLSAENLNDALAEQDKIKAELLTLRQKMGGLSSDAQQISTPMYATMPYNLS
jgi:chromosome segregation ATPase